MNNTYTLRVTKYTEGYGLDWSIDGRPAVECCFSTAEEARQAAARRFQDVAVLPGIYNWKTQTTEAE